MTDCLQACKTAVENAKQEPYYDPLLKEPVAILERRMEMPDAMQFMDNLSGQEQIQRWKTYKSCGTVLQTTIASIRFSRSLLT